MESKEERDCVKNSEFPTTRWTLILQASRQGKEAGNALESLCQSYWQPVYVYFRRCGESVHDAEDLTQGFFEDFLNRGSLDDAIPEKGKFRSYLLVAAKRYRSKAFRSRDAEKRGGKACFCPLDFSEAENNTVHHSLASLSPDRAFDLQWVGNLIDSVFGQLQQHYRNTGKGDLFDAIKDHLAFGEVEVDSYDATGQALRMDAGAVRTAVYRLRKRFRATLREEIEKTVSEGIDVDEELSHLIGLLQ